MYPVRKVLKLNKSYLHSTSTLACTVITKMVGIRTRETWCTHDPEMN